MIVGITGTQVGATTAQMLQLAEWLLELGAEELQHGDCIGADEQAHHMALAFRIPVVIRPPENESKRAFCRGAKLMFQPKPYLVRNREIVDASHVVIGLPKGPEEVRSGTWSTLRYAQKIPGKQVRWVYPNGMTVIQ